MSEQIVRDLAMLVVRLAVQIERVDPSNSVTATARGFLDRNGLLGHFSVTRDDEQPEAAE